MTLLLTLVAVGIVLMAGPVQTAQAGRIEQPPATYLLASPAAAVRLVDDQPEVAGPLDVSKRATTAQGRDGIVWNGERIDYTLVVTNTGNTPLNNIIIFDTLPDGLDELDCQQTGDADDCHIRYVQRLVKNPYGEPIPISVTDLITWSIPTLPSTPPNNVAEVWFSARVTGRSDGSSVKNVAEVKYQGGVAISNETTTLVRVNLDDVGVAAMSQSPTWLSSDFGGTISLDWGDFDRDGYLDLALGSTVGTTVYRFDPTDHRLTRFWGNDRYTLGVRWADLNMDGYLELVAVGESVADSAVLSGTNYIISSLHAGPIMTTTFTSGYQLLRVEPGDYDGDTDVDLLVSTNSLHRICPVLLYENDGSGQFGATPTGKCVSTIPTASFAPADADNDGELDLAMAAFPNSSLLLTGDVNSDPPLDVGRSIKVDDSTAFLPYDLAWGDYDRDGYLDLAAALPLDRKVRVYRNTADGQGRTLVAVPGLDLATQSFRSPLALDWADMDGDGWLDLIVADRPPRIYFNARGSGEWRSGFSEMGAVEGQVWSLAAGDVDADGDLDVALTNRDGASLRFSNFAPFLDTRITAVSTREASSVAWGDVWIDGEGQSEGYLDLLLGSWEDYDSQARVFGNEVGALVSKMTLGDSRWGPLGLAFGDVDGDTLLDLAVGGKWISDRLYLAIDRATVWPASNQWQPSDGTTGYAVAWGDAEGDGDLDLLVGNFGRTALYVNDGSGLADSPAWWSPSMRDTRAVAWGDYDGDGYLDIAVANYGQGDQVFHNERGNLFELAWTSGVPSDSTAVAWADYDGDGDQDVAFGRYGQPNVVYENESGSFGPDPVWTSDQIRNTTGLAWGDWDNDGDLDLAVGNHGEPDQVYTNQGSRPGFPRLLWLWTSSEVYQTTGIAWGDVDRDGDLDLAISRKGSGNNGYYASTYVQAAHLSDQFTPRIPSPNNPAYLEVDRPGETEAAYFFSSEELLAYQPATSTIPINFRVYDPNVPRNGTPPSSPGPFWFSYEYSVDGGGTWRNATGSLETLPDPPASRLGVDYTFLWDAATDDAIGDDARFRVRLVQQVASGPAQRGSTSAISPPFRVRATDCVWPAGPSIYYDPGHPERGEQVVFVGSVVQGTQEITFTWSFGDGTPDQQGQIVHHTYQQNGVYDLVMTVESKPCPVKGTVVAREQVMVGLGYESFFPLINRNLAPGGGLLGELLADSAQGLAHVQDSSEGTGGSAGQNEPFLGGAVSTGPQTLPGESGPPIAASGALAQRRTAAERRTASGVVSLAQDSGTGDDSAPVQRPEGLPSGNTLSIQPLRVWPASQAGSLAAQPAREGTGVLAGDDPFPPSVHTFEATEEIPMILGALHGVHGQPSMSADGGHLAFWSTGDIGANQCESQPLSDTIRILLVDDDWSSPGDPGGPADVLPTYVAALDALGFDYDIHDTRLSGEPQTLAPYAGVVWFTGEARCGSGPNACAGPSPDSEGLLAAFLDEGNFLFLSSQDYVYDRGGLSPFMVNYLGVEDVEGDVQQTEVAGAGSIFEGLGFYALDYTFPNRSDRIVAGTSAESAFIATHGSTAVHEEGDALAGGQFRTTFWGFPFEALPGSARVDIMHAFLYWLGLGCEVGGNEDGNLEAFIASVSMGLTPTITYTQLSFSVGSVLGGFNLWPSVDGTGSHVAFLSDANLIGHNADNNFEIFWSDAEGNLLQVTDRQGGASLWPSISGDGSRVVFVSDRDLVGGQNPDHIQQIFLAQVDPDAEPPVSLTQLSHDGEGEGYNDRPSISGNGAYVAYVHYDGTGHSWIRMYSTAGGELPAGFPVGHNLEPSLGFEGTRLAFVSDQDLDLDPRRHNADGNLEIFFADSSDGWSGDPTFTQVTSSTLPVVNGQPSLSALGSHVALVSGSDVWVYDHDGQAAVKFSDEGTSNSRPAVSADGVLIAYGAGNNLHWAINQVADLSVVKTGPAGEVTPGWPVSYEISATNLGPVNASGAILIDELPIELLEPAWTCGTSGGDPCEVPLQPEVLSVTVNIGVGGWITYAVSGILDPGAGDAVTNTAEILPAADAADTKLVNNTSVVSNSVQPVANLWIEKTADAGLVLAGNVLTYTLTYGNLDGPSNGRDVVISDTLQVGMTFGGVVAGLEPQPSPPGSHQITWFTPSVEVNSPQSIVYTVTVEPWVLDDTLTNTVVITGTSWDTDGGNNARTFTVDVDTEADLSIVKEDQPDPVVAGAPLTYTIRYTNTGPSDAQLLEISDTLPSEVEWDGLGAITVPPLDGPTFHHPRTWTWVTQTLPAGITGTITFVVTVRDSVAAPSQATNGVEIVSDTDDPVSNNNSFDEDTEIHIPVDLLLTKLVEPIPITAGQQLTYTILVENDSVVPVPGAQVTDVVPLEIRDYTWWCEPSQGSDCTPGPVYDQDIEDTVTIAAGGWLSYTLLGWVREDVIWTITNTAVVTVPAGYLDIDPTNNADSDVRGVETAADLAVSKTVVPEVVGEGETLVYTLVLDNLAGPSDALGVLLTDTLPVSTTYNAHWTTPGTDYDVASGLWTVGTLPAGTSVTLIITTEVLVGSSGTVIVNEVDGLTSSTLDPEPTNNTDAASASVPVLVSGSKWHDLNADRAGVDVEPPLEGWEIHLDGTDYLGDPVHLVAYTAPSGEYTFPVLAGDYTLSEVCPIGEGWYQSFPAPAPGGDCGSALHTISVHSGDVTVPGKHFGNYHLATVTGVKFDDRNGNGLDDTEPRLGDWQINLAGTSGYGEPVDELATTDGTGAFVFQVPPGTYTVTEVLQDNWVCSYPAGCQYSLALESGDQVPDTDFGNWAWITTAGVKFDDRDGDGAKDGTDPGLPNWEIHLDGSDGLGQPVNEVVWTDADGNYAFTVAPGSYVVTEVSQANWECSYPASCEYPLTLESGDQDLDNDFGNWEYAIAAGAKHEDVDGDGSIEGGEPALAGWEIHLDGQDGAGNTVSMQTDTDANGEYLFTVPPGIYTLSEVVQDGWQCSHPTPCVYPITLESGDEVPGNDFANWAYATAAGTKLEDTDGDGLIEAGEPVIAGWEIHLDGYDGLTNPVNLSTQTDASGTYTFTVPPGTYTLTEVLANNWECSYPTPCEYAVTLTSGGVDTGNDFANWEYATAAGAKLEDLDGDGTPDDGEPGLQDWTIYLDGFDGLGNPVGLDTQTDAGGAYSFLAPPGTYTVTEELLDGWVCSYPDGCQYDGVTLQSGDALQDLGFGNWMTATVTGAKFRDVDSDGIWDEGEPALSGWEIHLNGVDGLGNPVSLSTQTDVSGTYTFAVAPGTYTVTEVLQANWACSAPADCEYPITAQSGFEYVDNDFGNYESTTLSGVKFDDLDGDGEKDANEPGLEGWTIYVDVNGNGSLQPKKDQWAVSGADGSYFIDDVPARTLAVREVYEAHPGWFCSYPANGPNCYHQIQFQQGQGVSGVNFGNWTWATVAGVKFHDQDADGQYDGGEPGLQSWEFHLEGTAGSGEPVSRTASTDANGHYAFTVPPGAYTVTETLQVGWTCSFPDPCEYSFVIVSGGESLANDFGNYETGTLLVQKVTDPPDSIQSFNFAADPPLDPLAFSLQDGGSQLFSDLPVGTYGVTETLPAGWMLDVVCSDGSDPEAIDLGPGEAVTCTFTNTELGSITVQKVTDPGGSAQTFNFTADAPLDPGAFTLTDGQSQAFSDLVPGTYVVAETVPAGWTLDVVCSDGSDPASIELAAGEDVVCTFTNTELGSITVQKVTDPGGSAQTFDFTADAPLNPGAFTLTDGQSQAFLDLVPGTYVVAETVPAGWALVAVCDDGSNPGSIDLAAGEDVVCTFTNTELGSITVQKVTDPGGSAQTFDFTADAPLNPGAFTLSDGQSQVYSDLVPGTYGVAETVPDGWVLDVVCSDGSDPEAIDLGPGEAVTCTFTNTELGSITVQKVTDPGGSAQTFGFTANAPLDPGAFTLTDGQSQAFTDLVPGTYGVAETVPAGWSLVAVCDDGSNPASIELAAGEDVVCTFTNTELGSITVQKVTDPGGSAQTFDFTANAPLNPGAFTLTDGQSQAFSDLVPGTYVVAETVPAGWSLVAVCDDGSNPGSIDLAAGEDVVCTFTNTELGSITVQKVTDPGGSAQTFDFTADAPLDPGAFTLTDGQSQLFSDLVVGTYGVTETVPAGWSLVAVCDDGSDPETIDLAVGEDVVCTFTNTQAKGPTGGPEPPRASGDAYTVDEDSQSNILEVLTNDVVVTESCGPLIIQGVTEQSGTGTIVNESSHLIYTPPKDFSGAEWFDYTIGDACGGTSQATVTIVVTSINDAPRAVADSAWTARGLPVTIDVTANDTDADQDSLWIVDLGTPLLGVATIGADGTIVYTPSDVPGVDTFSYTVTDGIDTAMTTVSVTVEPFLLRLSVSPDPLGEGVQRFTASVIPTATLPLTFTWQAAGSSVEIHSGVFDLSDSVTFTWRLTSVRFVTVTVTSMEGSVQEVYRHTPYRQYLPMVFIRRQ